MIAVLLEMCLVLCPLFSSHFDAGDMTLSEGAKVIGSAFSITVIFAVLLSILGINEVCIQLEEPFGNDANDLPLLGFHRHFVDMLEAIYFAPQLFTLDPAFPNYMMDDCSDDEVDPEE